MKYLKKYKLFESFNFSEIVSDLESILLEIDDIDGYKTKIKEHRERVKPRLTSDIYYEVSINRPSDFIDINEIDDCIKRLINYIDSTNMFKSKSVLATYMGSGRRSKESNDLFVNQEINLEDLYKIEIISIKLRFKIK